MQHVEYRQNILPSVRPTPKWGTMQLHSAANEASNWFQNQFQNQSQIEQIAKVNPSDNKKVDSCPEMCICDRGKGCWFILEFSKALKHILNFKHEQSTEVRETIHMLKVKHMHKCAAESET